MDLFQNWIFANYILQRINLNAHRADGLVVFSSLLAPNLGPLGDVFRRVGWRRRIKLLENDLGNLSVRLTHSINFVEDRNAQADGNEVVSPDPVVLNVEFKRKLGNFGCEGVREFHRTRWGFSWFVGHLRCFYWDLLKVRKLIRRLRLVSCSSSSFGGFSKCKEKLGNHDQVIRSIRRFVNIIFIDLLGIIRKFL